MLGEGVSLLQRQVEADHGITVQVVVVGDCELDDALRALLDAAREATVNAAKWSGADQVSVFAEVEPDTVQIYVRDRGQGFDRAGGAGGPPGHRAVDRGPASPASAAMPSSARPRARGPRSSSACQGANG